MTSAWWHPLDNKWRLFRKHTWDITSPFGCPISWSSGAEYLADVVDKFQWEYLTEYGLIWYQRSRNHLRTSFCVRSFVAKFRKPSLYFLSIRIRERFYTELDE